MQWHGIYILPFFNIRSLNISSAPRQRKINLNLKKTTTQALIESTYLTMSGISICKNLKKKFQKLNLYFSYTLSTNHVI